MNVFEYLHRISYTGPTEPTADVLKAIHRAHMMAVPFENLDIQLGRKIICDESSAIHKVVERRRGGFCYELNGAFSALLRELGFKITLLSARVARQDGSYGAEFDHLTLRVDLDEPWLADVGFGDSFIEPLRLNVDLEQPQGKRNFRIVEEAHSLQMEMAEFAGEWKREYSFTLMPRQLGDFSEMCHYHQTSPQSSFTQKSVCSMATPSGRITITDRKLIITQNGKREESTLHTDEEWRAALRQYFGVVL